MLNNSNISTKSQPFFPPVFLERSKRLASMKRAQDEKCADKLMELRLSQVLDQGAFTKNALVRSIYVGNPNLEKNLAEFISATVPDTLAHKPKLSDAAILEVTLQTSTLIADTLVASQFKRRSSPDVVQRLKQYAACQNYVHIPVWMGSVIGYTALVAAPRVVPSFHQAAHNHSHSHNNDLGDPSNSVFHLDIGVLADMAPKHSSMGATIVGANSGEFLHYREQAIRAGFLVVTGFQADTLARWGTVVYSLFSDILKERLDAATQLNKNTGVALLSSLQPTAQAFFAEFMNDPSLTSNECLMETKNELQKRMAPLFDNAISADLVRKSIEKQAAHAHEEEEQEQTDGESA